MQCYLVASLHSRMRAVRAVLSEGTVTVFGNGTLRVTAPSWEDAERLLAREANRVGARPVGTARLLSAFARFDLAVPPGASIDLLAFARAFEDASLDPKSSPALRLRVGDSVVHVYSTGRGICRGCSLQSMETSVERVTSEPLRLFDKSKADDAQRLLRRLKRRESQSRGLQRDGAGAGAGAKARRL